MLGLGVEGDVPAVVRGERRAPMERPLIDEGITESYWSFFLAEWSCYKEATAITGEGLPKDTET